MERAEAAMGLYGGTRLLETLQLFPMQDGMPWRAG